jgi:hypothetical protein
MQVASGSRGKEAQIVRSSLAPVYAVDMNQLPKPLVIKNSFTKGLTPVEYFNVASQGRFSSVSSANATAEPGALSKILVANTEDQKITIDDCRTSNGIKMSMQDDHIVGRFEAGTNKLITLADFKKMSKKNGNIKVRSATTCEAPRGVCVKCYGMRSNGKLAKVGDNVGIEASQTIGQILTQMTLSTKHSTMGKNTGEVKLEGIPGFNALYGSKESSDGMAIVSKSDGIVRSITKNLSGGSIVQVGNKKYDIPKGKKIKTKIGMHIQVGDSITEGFTPPSETMRRRGLFTARQAEADEAHAIFKRSTGRDLQKKHFEVISRGHFSLAVDKYGNHSSYEESTQNYPKRFLMKMVSEDLVGMYIGQNIDYIMKGTKITKKLIGKFKKWNIKRIPVTTERPAIKPMYKSLEQRPMYNNSLFGKMNYRGVGKAIREQVVYGGRKTVNSDKSRYSGHF